MTNCNLEVSGCRVIEVALSEDLAVTDKNYEKKKTQTETAGVPAEIQTDQI
jgi:hypothetical protein